jgi:hypothetical protein
MPRLIQDTLKPLIEFKKFKGIDNLCTDDLRLDPGFVRVANNIDIDSEMMARRRKGVLDKVVNGSAHSLWSDEDKLCFGVIANDLVQINTDWSTSLILATVGPTKMNFLKIGERVFFSNRIVTGYILDKVAYAFPEDVRPQRQRMVGGELIEYLNARFYAAQDDTIYRSVAGNPMEMDLENNFIVVGGPVTMLMGVGSDHLHIHGLYVSAGGKCIYLSNLEPDLVEAHYKLILDVPALPGSAVAIERMALGKDVIGRCCVWSTVIGIFMGLPGGKVRDLTSDHYAVMDIEEGASLIKWHNGYRQYIFMGQEAAETAWGDIKGILPGPLVDLTSGILEPVFYARAADGLTGSDSHSQTIS